MSRQSLRDVTDPRISGIASAAEAIAVLGALIPPWHRDALCAQTDPEAFFPEKGGSTREAKAVCRRCDVRADCLLWALEHDEAYGIWGGMSERQRRNLKKSAS